ncbi:MAG: tetratricopeptide repeat protein [Bacteroidaceae bacterium]|nr:tetratricopeptide repeat protein [Bacteroidaceae bacterium]
MSENKKNAPNMEAALEQTFVQKNLKKIGACIGIVLIVVFAAIGCKYYFESQSKKAAEALYPCEQQFLQGNYEKALNGDGLDVIGLVEVAKKYSSTKSGNLAKLYTGLAYYKLGKMEDAENYLDDFDAKDDEMISPAAIGALGNVYAELGQNDKAVETLKKAAKKADSSVLSPIFLIQAGEILEGEGKTAEALKLYEEIQNHYRSSMQGQVIEKYIERAKLAK